jgi:hypothetical protein
MRAFHKNESPVAAGQVARTHIKFTIDSIALYVCYAGVNAKFNILFLVLALQFVAMIVGAL